jgi:hypothetical protein
MVLRLLVLGLLAAGFNAKPASAQVLKGTFTLPSAIRWSYATLPAGDYAFSLDKDYAGSVVKVFRGGQCVAQIPTPITEHIKSVRSEMVLENGAVNEVSLPQIGVSLRYPAPNRRHRAPQEMRAALVIPIATAGAGR